MLELIYTSTKTVDVPNLPYCFMVYHKVWDCMFLYDGYYPLKGYRLFRDGTMAQIVSSASAVDRYLIHNRVGSSHVWDYNYPSTIQGLWLGSDDVSGNWHYDQILNENWVQSYDAGRHGGFVDDQRNLIIYAYVWSRLHFIDTEAGAEIAYLTLPGDRRIYSNITWVKSGQVVAIDHGTGVVVFIDYVNREILWQTTVRPCVLSAYDSTHNLVITVESDKKIRIYTLDIVPAVLANPTFSPVPHQLVGSIVTTRLTGSAGEVCPNWWINWEVLGGKGDLMYEHTKTDANGYATNYYYGPEDPADCVEETVQVNVVVPQ